MGSISVYKWLIKDWCVVNLRLPMSCIKLLKFLVLLPFDQVKSLTNLMSAHRYYPIKMLDVIVNLNMKRIQKNIKQLIESDFIDKEKELLKHVAIRSIILKWPSKKNDIIEKGVLLITFTTTFPFYYSNIDLKRLQKYFHIVLEPSWAGYCLGNILFWSNGDMANPVIIQSTERTDFRFIQSLKSNLIPVDFGASDWVDHTIFQKINNMPKDYDSIYVANYRDIKRQHVYFKALSQINVTNYKAAIVCGKWGNGKDTIHELIDYYKIRNKIDVYEALSLNDLNLLLNRSKVNVLLSFKEGSNRSVFESLFAGTPGIVLINNIGLNKDYINKHTGMLVKEKNLAKALIHFKESWKNYRPREWALENISPEVTTRKLENVLKSIANTWENNLEVKVNRPEVQYYFPSKVKPGPMDLKELLMLFSIQETINDDALESELFR
jgi:hypothetical protein